MTMRSRRNSAHEADVLGMIAPGENDVSQVDKKTPFISEPKREPTAIDSAAGAPQFDEQAHQIRFQRVIDRLGGLRQAADLVGSHADTVGRWRDGRQKLPFHAAAALCQAAGLSMDWLAFGEDDGAALQGERLTPDAVRESAEFVFRAADAFVGLGPPLTSDQIADAIVRRAQEKVIGSRRDTASSQEQTKDDG